MQSRDINSFLLVHPAIRQKGTGDQSLFRQINPKADLKRFPKIMIDPVG